MSSTEDKLTILLDMDGVIANFVQRSIEVHDLDLKHDDVKSWSGYFGDISLQDFMDKIDDTPDFWLSLEVYPWAHDLHAMCRLYGNVVFATKPSEAHDCASQKIQWLRTNGFMGQRERNFMIGPDKHLMSREGVVLIDDCIENIEAFNSCGEGIGLLFPQPWNCDVTADRVEEIRNALWLCSSAWDKSKLSGVANGT